MICSTYYYFLQMQNNRKIDTCTETIVQKGKTIVLQEVFRTIFSSFWTLLPPLS